MKDETVNKIILLLDIMSLISAFAIVILFIYTINGSMFTEFIVEWILIGPFVILMFPLCGYRYFGWLTKGRMPPKIWLTIYTIVVALYSFFLLGSGHIAAARDLPLAFGSEYSSIIGEARIIDATDRTQRIRVANQRFTLYRRHFNYVTPNNTYQVNYLPNSRYVVDVIDENGQSLSRR